MGSNIHFIGLGFEGTNVVRYLNQHLGVNAKYSYISKNDNAYLISDAVFYDMFETPKEFLTVFTPPENLHILISVLGEEFTSECINKLNYYLKSENINFINLMIEPLGLEGKSLNLASEVKKDLQRKVYVDLFSLNKIKKVRKEKKHNGSQIHDAYDDILKHIKNNYLPR